MKKMTLVAALVMVLAGLVQAALWKNTAGQKVYCYAWDTAANAPKTGDAANISATISKDGGASAALTDTTATEIGNGVYVFDLTQAETNADVVAVMFTSSTTGVQCQPIIAYTQPVVRQADIAQVNGTAIPTPTVAGYLPVDVWYSRGATPMSDADIKAQVDQALADIYLDEFIANPLTDPGNVANSSILAKLASAGAVWTSFNPTTDSLEALADGIAGISPGSDTGLTVVATSTPTRVTVSVGNVDIAENAWKDCLARVYHDDWSASVYARIVYNTAQSGDNVILYVTPALPFTPTVASDKVYIEGWGLRPSEAGGRY